MDTGGMVSSGKTVRCRQKVYKYHDEKGGHYWEIF
jgi:hypothetical protein